MLLVQVGGPGIMTVATVGAVLVGRRVGFKDLLTLLEELGNVESPRNTLRLIGQIAGITLLLETVGAVLFVIVFALRGMSLSESVFNGVFMR